jgi:hypothetical protein
MALIGAYTYNRKLNYSTIPGRGHITANLTNFPICVHISASSWSSSTDRNRFFDASNVDGKRIQFYDYDTTTNLPYEVEYYDGTLQEAIYWVKIPTVLHDGDANYATRNFLYTGYGNDPDGNDYHGVYASYDAQRWAVWDGNYKMVLHMGDNSWVSSPAPECKDSTSYAQDSTNQGSSDTNGIARQGRYFSSNYIEKSTFNLPTGSGARTISTWFQATSNNTAQIVGWGNNSTSNRFCLLTNSAGRLSTELCNGERGFTWTYNTNWHYLATTYPAGGVIGDIKLFYDGTEQSCTTYNSTSINTTLSNFNIGKFSGYSGYYFYGNIDEIRISDIVRSADWQALEYYTVKKSQFNGDSWLQWEGEPSYLKSSYLNAEVEYTLEGNVVVSNLQAEVEYDLASSSLQTSQLVGEVEYDIVPNLWLGNLRAEVEYDDTIQATAALFASQVLGEIEYDIANPSLQTSQLIGEVEYDVVSNLLISRLMAEVEYDSTNTVPTTQTFTHSILTGTVGVVQVTQTFINGFSTTSSFVNDWDNNVQWFTNSILSDTTGITQELSNSLLTYNPVATSQIISFSILSAYEFESMTPTYQILLDGIDISQKVLSCNITYNRSNFVGECSIVWKDWTIFNNIDCSDYTKNYAVERIEVKTRLEDTDDWTSHGTFFIEKRDTAMSVDEILPTSWGRNKPAILSEPFAQTITKTWDYDTTAKSIALEVINGLCELDWQIMDYPVYTGRFSANKERPIAILNRLAQVLGAIVTTDKSGRVRVIYEWQM